MDILKKRAMIIIVIYGFFSGYVAMLHYLIDLDYQFFTVIVLPQLIYDAAGKQMIPKCDATMMQI